MSVLPQLTFLGTGSAFPTQSYNSCFVLDDGSLRLLVDAGGGYEITRRLRDCGIDIATITDFFITHCHTDHILGAIWVVRSVINSYIKGEYTKKLNIYGNTEVIDALDTIGRLTLLPSHYKLMRELSQYINIETDSKLTIKKTVFHFFDVGSPNVCQTGFSVLLSTGRRLVFLGDESLTEHNAPICRGADLVVCGAFCRKADAHIFKPYEKHHHTVEDVALKAEQAHVGNLILIHAEDTSLAERQHLFAAEAGGVYSGNVVVPIDGETLTINTL